MMLEPHSHRHIPSAPRFQAKSCRKHEDNLSWFVRALWKALPECHSEHELSNEVAKFLTREGQPVEPRTVRYWLRQETAPHFRYVFPILALAGAEAVMERVFGTVGRS